MKRFVLSTLTVILAASAASPMAQASEIQKLGLHQVRTTAFDQRAKADEKSPYISAHQKRLAEMDRRNKSEYEAQSEFNLQRLRLANRDRRNKSAIK